MYRLLFTEWWVWVTGCFCARTLIWKLNYVLVKSLSITSVNTVQSLLNHFALIFCKLCLCTLVEITKKGLPRFEMLNHVKLFHIFSKRLPILYNYCNFFVQISWLTILFVFYVFKTIGRFSLTKFPTFAACCTPSSADALGGDGRRKGEIRRTVSADRHRQRRIRLGARNQRCFLAIRGTSASSCTHMVNVYVNQVIS